MAGWLTAECLRLHKMVIDGRDAHNKLAAVVSMLLAEGIPIPETDPPIGIIKK